MVSADKKHIVGVHTPMSMVPLLPLTLAVGEGMIFAHYTQYGLLGTFAAGISLILIAGFALAYRYVIWSLGFGVGCMLGVAAAPASCPVPEGHRYQCSAIVTRSVEQNRGQRLSLSVDSIGGVKVTPFNMIVINDESENLISPGYRMGFVGEINAPRPTIDYPDQIDYDSLALSQGYVAKVFLTEDDIKYIVPAEGLQCMLRRCQGWLKGWIADAGVDYETWAFLCATVAGDPSALDPDNRAKFSQAGLAHMLALSGLHVAIIAAIGSVLLLPLRLIAGRRVQSLVLLILIWIYAGVTGLSTSVVRASLMISLALIAVCFNLRNSSANSLCVAALIIAVVDPSQVFTLGFSLSFLAVAGILILSPHLVPGRLRHKWVKYPLGLIAASLGATVFTFPVVAYTFHTFPLAFLPANLLAAPLLTILVAGGFILALLAGCGITWPWMAEILNNTNALLQKVSQTVASWDWTHVDALYLHPMTPWLLLAVVVAFVLWMRKRNYYYLIVSGAMAVGAIILYASQPVLAEEGEYFIRQKRQTEVLLHRGDTLWLFTNAKGLAAEESLAQHSRQAQEFIVRRDIKTIALLPDSCRKQGIMRQGEMLEINGIKYWFDAGTAANKDVQPPSGINCYVACRGGKKNVVELAKKARADTVLLSYDLSHGKRERLKDELSQNRIPFRCIQ